MQSINQSLANVVNCINTFYKS